MLWKIVVRGLRESLERRVCRTNVYSQSQDNRKSEIKTNLTCQRNILPPAVLVTCDKDFCGSTKSAGAKDNEQDFRWNAKHSWTEAVGWSSALAAGWVVCQTLCLHKRFFCGESKEKTSKSKLFNCAGVSHLLAQISSLQPSHVLPVTNCIGNSNRKPEWREQDADTRQWSAEATPFGPITIEEELRRVADEFANTHKVVLGEYELRCGIRDLKEKRYKDALMHFATGAKMSSPGSMFNLGLCYELGMGTVADASEAARHYNDAATHDHADALYNLGVFHAQGRGGLPVDTDTARTYFTKAARLGQVQAERALSLEKSGRSKRNSSDVVLDASLGDLTASSEATANVKLGFYSTLSRDAACDDTSSASLAESRVDNDRVGYDKRIFKDATRVFLGFSWAERA